MKNEKKEPIILIDKETGEYLKTIDASDRIIPKYIIDKWQENEQDRYYVNYSRDFIKMFSGVSIELKKTGLNLNEVLIVLYLCETVRYSSGACLHKNNKPITKINLSNKFDLSEKTIDIIIGKLIKSEIISLVKDDKKTKIFFNPYVAMRGRYVSENLYEMFKNSCWAKVCQTEEVIIERKENIKNGKVE